MITFDSSEIANWADKPGAQHQLPELIRRLMLATVPMPSLSIGLDLRRSGVLKCQRVLVVGQCRANAQNGLELGAGVPGGERPFCLCCDSVLLV